MKRAGFTMIELIFVIVILGILAAVAIPKLSATRTDAEVSKIAADTATLISDLGTYYTSQGTFANANIKNITNLDIGTNTSLTKGASFNIKDSGNKTCLTVTFDDVEDGNVTVAKGTGTSSVCKSVKSATTNLIDKTYHFGGSQIKR